MLIEFVSSTHWQINDKNKIIDFPCTKTELISMILSILIFNLSDLIPKKSIFI